MSSYEDTGQNLKNVIYKKNFPEYTMLKLDNLQNL